MSNIHVKKCPIEGLYIIEPKVFKDDRGYFIETYNARDMKEEGLDISFVQDNQSMSHKGVLRGLHYQINHPQGKLIRVISGSIYDVAVDLRKGSPTHGKPYGQILSDTNNLQFYVPQGFAHGFLVLSDTAVILYKVTDFYHPNDEGGVAWDDPDISVQWPLGELNGSSVILSNRDQKHPWLKDLKE